MPSRTPPKRRPGPLHNVIPDPKGVIPDPKGVIPDLIRDTGVAAGWCTGFGGPTPRLDPGSSPG